MLKSKHLIYPTIFVLCLSLVGCAAMQRKFARRKKEKEEKHAPIIVKTFDYSKDLRVDELYKRHFLFWQSWHSELIDRMDSSYKKRSECYAHIISSLSEMNKYLNSHR